ncbi:MAG: hypothetical protein GF330_10140 [Candidatus Eisenbacteria bacterium]|nr:hypothetical protein [Candidatus Eisenbacteria bacterium]
MAGAEMPREIQHLGIRIRRGSRPYGDRGHIFSGGTMFGKTEQEGNPIRRGDARNEQSLLQRGVKLQGEIEAAGDLRIEGRILGILDVSGSAIIGPDAEAKGLLKGREVVIHGAVEGTVVAEQRLHLAGGAKVKADIYCESLMIDEGVLFQGRSHMGQQIPDVEKLRSQMFSDLAAEGARGVERATRGGTADPGPPGGPPTEASTGPRERADANKLHTAHPGSSESHRRQSAPSPSAQRPGAGATGPGATPARSPRGTGQEASGTKRAPGTNPTRTDGSTKPGGNQARAREATTPRPDREKS